MSTFNELEVYKISYDLAIHVFRFTEKMRRTYKYTLGEKLNDNVVSLLLSVYKANSDKKNRYTLLQAGRENIIEIRLLLRMCKDLQLLTVNRYVVLNEMMENIAKQFYGWQQSAVRPATASNGKPEKPEMKQLFE